MPDVWFASLEPGAARLADLEATLGADERDRAARFRFDRDRRWFVAARGLLREILGAKLDLDPAAVRFDYGPQGKPALRRGCSGGELFFNVAHSAGHGAFATATVPGIGIDVEVVRPVPDADSIARRFFAAEECAAIATLPAALRLHAFFLCWTRKEAFVKALGEGLSHPLDTFAVTVAPHEAPRLLHAGGEGDVEAWTFHDLSDLPALACAVAVRDDRSAVRMRGWAPHGAVASSVT